MSRSGVFSDADVHAAVIEPIQPDVDAVVRDAVAYFDRIEGNLDERFYDRHFDLRPSIAEDSLYVHSLCSM
jgi:hypothetical protein